MRVVCAKKESTLGLRGAIPGSEALDRKGLADLAREKEPGAGVCRLLEVESEGAAFGERASAIGEADRRDGTLVCLALRPARGTNISAPSTRAPAIGRPTSTVIHVGNGRRRFWRKRDKDLLARLGPGGRAATMTLAELVDEYLEMHAGSSGAGHGEPTMSWADHPTRNVET